MSFTFGFNFSRDLWLCVKSTLSNCFLYTGGDEVFKSILKDWHSKTTLERRKWKILLIYNKIQLETCLEQLFNVTRHYLIRLCIFIITHLICHDSVVYDLIGNTLHNFWTFILQKNWTVTIYAPISKHGYNFYNNKMILIWK